MSREEKITKLCRAVRAYRGAAHGKDKEGNTIWSIPPKPAERTRVLACLETLGFDLERKFNELELIDSLETIQEFRQWVETLR